MHQRTRLPTCVIFSYCVCHSRLVRTLLGFECYYYYYSLLFVFFYLCRRGGEHFFFYRLLIFKLALFTKPRTHLTFAFPFCYSRHIFFFSLSIILPYLFFSFPSILLTKSILTFFFLFIFLSENRVQISLGFLILTYVQISLAQV